MSRSLAVGAIAACAALLTSPLARADRVEPVPVYGFYDVHVDFAQQTFNGMPDADGVEDLPRRVQHHCDVFGCVMRMDNSGDVVRNPAAPLEYEYRWNTGRWETSGEQPYLCQRTDPDSGGAVAALGLLDPELRRRLSRRTARSSSAEPAAPARGRAPTGCRSA